MKRKLVCDYSADAGTCVINNIGINNGYGDGEFSIYYVNELPKKAKLVKDVWIDLRNEYDIIIHRYDCNRKSDEFLPNKTIAPSEFRKYFGNAQALQVAYDYGDIYLVKYF